MRTRELYYGAGRAMQATTLPKLENLAVEGIARFLPRATQILGRGIIRVDQVVDGESQLTYEVLEGIRIANRGIEIQTGNGLGRFSSRPPFYLYVDGFQGIELDDITMGARVAYPRFRSHDLKGKEITRTGLFLGSVQNPDNPLSYREIGYFPVR